MPRQRQPTDGCCWPIPDSVEVPDGYHPLRCLRCGQRLLIHDDTWWDITARRQLTIEHHAWLCPVPTPNVAAARRRAAERRDLGG